MRRITHEFRMELMYCMFLFMMLMVFAAVCVYLLEFRYGSEDATIENLSDALYWAIISVSMIGYDHHILLLSGPQNLLLAFTFCLDVNCLHYPWVCLALRLQKTQKMPCNKGRTKNFRMQLVNAFKDGGDSSS